MKNNLKKTYIWNTLGSAINAFNSFFFLVIVTRINGIDKAGIFTLSYASACMLYAIAIYSGRTYQVTEVEKDITDNEYIVNRILCSIIMLIISLVFALIKHYQSLKLTIFILLCVFKATEALCDVFHGILQKNNKLDIVGKSLFLRGITNIIIFLIIDKITNNLILATLSLIVINIIILLLIDIKKSIKYKEKSDKIKIDGVIKILKLGFFTFGFSFIANYLVNAPRYAIDSFMKEEFQTIFGIVVMPATVIMLVNQFIVQPIIISLKESYKERNKKKFLKIAFIIIIATIITGLVAILFAYLLGIPILNFVYNLDLKDYLKSLIIVLIGATIYTVANVFSTCLVVLRKTKVQLIIYIITSIFAYLISNWFVKLYNFDGAIYAYLFIMIMLLVFYIITFVIIINKKEIWSKE